jgi:uncharacterized membrane protein SpoIIM required for sporulation
MFEMKEAKFIKQHSDTWKALENILSGKSNMLNAFEIMEKRMNLYRAVCRHLSYAQTYYPDSSLCTYLARLTSEAHAAIYVHTQKRSIWGFLSRGLPGAIRTNSRFILVSAAVFGGAALISFAVSLFNPDIASVFLPAELQDMVQNTNPEPQASVDSWISPLMSGYIMVNNIYVSVLALGLGLTCGIGTIYVLATNGFLLGSLAAVYAANGGSLVFWSLILPHGVWELTAIAIAGGIGLKIGYSLIRPGIYKRSDSLLMAARSSISLIALIVIMLIVAGIIEGFFTPSNVSPTLKLAFAAATIIPLTLYLRLGKNAILSP